MHSYGLALNISVEIQIYHNDALCIMHCELIKKVYEHQIK